MTAPTLTTSAVAAAADMAVDDVVEARVSGLGTVTASFEGDAR